MAVKGTDVKKKLPGTNCKECGLPTCFGFAMKLASGKVKPDVCPYLDLQVKEELEDLLAPPMKLVTVGTGSQAVSLGEEEVMFRHEKTFFHSPGLALLISDTEPDNAVIAKIKKIEELQFERVGINLKADLLALRFASGDKARYVALAEKVAAEAPDLGIVLISEDTEALFAALDAYGAAKRPLLYPVTADNIAKVMEKVKEKPTPVGLKAGSVEEIAVLATKLRATGIEEIVLDPSSKNLSEVIRDQTLIRRSALKKGFRPLGFPSIAFPCDMTDDKMQEALIAAGMIAKYVGIIVLSDMDKSSLLPLLVLRLNIYTDPRRPMTVEEKIYEINEPDAEAPVIVTTNFALTYFAVSSEMETSKVPSYLCIQDTEGLCVLAAWSTGKFAADTISSYIKRSGITDKVNHRNLIIPGYIAQIKGELEEALPDWQIIVGAREASGIPALLKEQ